MHISNMYGKHAITRRTERPDPKNIHQHHNQQQNTALYLLTKLRR